MYKILVKKTYRKRPLENQDVDFIQMNFWRNGKPAIENKFT